MRKRKNKKNKSFMVIKEGTKTKRPFPPGQKERELYDSEEKTQDIKTVMSNEGDSK